MYRRQVLQKSQHRVITGLRGLPVLALLLSTVLAVARLKAIPSSTLFLAAALAVAKAAVVVGA
jgi:hypothetical protein